MTRRAQAYRSQAAADVASRCCLGLVDHDVGLMEDFTDGQVLHGAWVPW
jgi:hypothetical protein